MNNIMPWVIGIAALLLLAWLMSQHLKEERLFMEGEEKREAPVDQFLKDWGESEDAKNHTT